MGKKLMFVGGVLVVAALTVGAVNHQEKQAQKESLPPNVAEYTVLPGDTLWQIAGDYTPAGEDIRETIYNIKMDNPEIKNGLQVGQVLKITTGRKEQ